MCRSSRDILNHVLNHDLGEGNFRKVGKTGNGVLSLTEERPSHDRRGKAGEQPTGHRESASSRTPTARRRSRSAAAGEPAGTRGPLGVLGEAFSKVAAFRGVVFSQHTES